VEERRIVPVEENKAVVRAWIEATNALDESAIDRYIAEDFVNHTVEVFPNTPPGKEGLRKTWLTAAEVNRAEGVRRDVEFQVGEGDFVVTRILLSGKHTSTYLGLPATGKSWRMGAIVVNRVAGGQLVEQWGELDVFGKLRQLGGVVRPGE
jgi:predicted ester cyclase